MSQQSLLPFPGERDHHPTPLIPTSEELLAAIIDLLLQVLADVTKGEEEPHDD